MEKESPKLYDFRVGVDRISSVSGRSVHKNGSFDWMIVKIGDKNALIVRSHIELRKPGGTVVKCFFSFNLIVVINENCMTPVDSPTLLRIVHKSYMCLEVYL